MKRSDVVPVAVGKSGTQYAWWRGVLVSLGAVDSIGRLSLEDRDEVHAKLLRRLGR